MSGSLATFLIKTAEQARQVVHPEIRAKLLEDLIDEGAARHPDHRLRAILHHGRAMVLRHGRQGGRIPQPQAGDRDGRGR